MSRVFEFGGSCIKGSKTIDLHDKCTPLVDILAFGLLFLGKVNCDDFMCSDDELSEAMKEIEKENMYGDKSVFDAFAKRKNGKLKTKFKPKQRKH